jgi:hypothetical protein
LNVNRDLTAPHRNIVREGARIDEPPLRFVVLLEIDG